MLGLTCDINDSVRSKYITLHQHILLNNFQNTCELHSCVTLHKTALCLLSGDSVKHQLQSLNTSDTSLEPYFLTLSS